jgi:hypothetical protein
VFKEDHKIFKGRFVFAGKDQYVEIPKLMSQLSKVIRNAMVEGDESMSSDGANEFARNASSSIDFGKHFDSDASSIKSQAFENTMRFGRTFEGTMNHQ